MTVTRKPVMASTPPPGSNPAPLPYPVSPSSPRRPIFAGTPPQRDDQSQYLEKPPPFQSHSYNSSLSDLSDGWVDGGFHHEGDTAGTHRRGQARTPPKESGLPNTLQAGTRYEGGDRARSPNLTGVDAHGIDRMASPQVPAPLRVTPPPPNHTNNPFHRSRSSESARSHEQPNESDKDADYWAGLAAGPPRGSPSPQLLPLPDVANLNVSGTPPKHYRPYSPAAGQKSTPQQNNSQPILEPPPDRPLELPASPVDQQTHQQSGDDVYGSLAELDTTPYSAPPPPPQRPPPIPEPAPEPETPIEALPSLAPEPKGKAKLDTQDQAKQYEPIGENPWTIPAPPGAWSDESEPEPDLTRDVPLPQDVKPRIDVPPAQDVKPRVDVETPVTRANRQRAETYRIKKVRWVDGSSPEVRSSPIMIQNANGPCPLLSLVNALTLSTPARLETALVETLRSREQVSLGLLLDAVFDELMSGRRGDAAQRLPDVSELYTFLLTLHTGMNVNPRFLPPPKDSVNLIDGFDTPRSPSFDDNRPPGGFEDTREMKLYGTFAVPLVHGWLPPRTHPAYAALKRSAPTYEDAQNLMFREEELEGKMQRGGLDAEEQQLLEDIATVKYFLSSSSTQLTSYGLDVVTDSMMPGAISILFRNDHFSTLYKHPRSGQLLTLVTDEGYSSHDEVVWESLVDVSGEGCEFYSGDFRPVGFGGGASSPPPAADIAPHDEKGWTTVTRSGKPGVTSPVAGGASRAPDDDEYNLPSARNTEQEDADLALAMQLQEEEEDRQRRATEARQREEEAASQAFISQEVSNTSPRTSSRRDPQTYQHPANLALNNLTARQRQNRGGATGGNRRTGGASGGPAAQNQGATNHGATAAAHPPPQPPRRERDPEAGEDQPPPTYEQAAHATPYHGPVPSPSNNTSYAAMRASNAAHRDPYTRNRATSAYSQHRATMPGQAPPNPSTVRRTASGHMQDGDSVAGSSAAQRRERERDKDCIVM